MNLKSYNDSPKIHTVPQALTEGGSSQASGLDFSNLPHTPNVSHSPKALNPKISIAVTGKSDGEGC